MKKLSLIIVLTSFYFAGYASGSLSGKCTPSIVGSGFSGTTTYCAGVAATALSYNYAECSSGTGTATGVACTATWYYNTTNTTTISGATVIVSGPTAFTSAAGVNGNLPTVTPATTTAGTYYYFCVVSWVVSGTCTSPFTTATQAITINPVPGAITGSSPICVGSTISLSNAITGGTWSSSNTADATVGSITGIVTGVISAKPTITYLLPGGCKATSIVTVNPLPATITGTATVCTGLTTTLADATAGGTWTSSNMAVATIGSTRIVSGITAGTTNISYSLATGCYQATTVTVNQAPAAITGSSPVCVGSTISLNNTITGGTWSSSNAADAAVGSITGVVTGVISAKPTITYLLADGCKVTSIVTVNPLPAAITGTATVCTGLTTTLADATAGGTWTSSNMAVATIGSTKIVSGITAGTTNISYSLATGCYKTTTVTVNQAPAAITGSSPVCVGSTISLNNTITGGTWSSSNAADAAVGSITGIVTGVISAKPTITYLLADGCKVTSIVTVNPLPAAITGTASVCTGLTTTLADATAGGTWTSSNMAVATIGSTKIVSGITAGITDISYSLATGCYKTTTVTVNQTPGAITGTNVVCVGATITLSDTTAGGTWTSSSAADATVGSTTGIVKGILGATTPTITYIGANSCKTKEVITVNANPTAILGVTSECAGSTITLSDAKAGGTWSGTGNVSVATIGSNSGTVSASSLAGTGTVTYSFANGCYVINTNTINPIPSEIEGTFTVCAGAVTTLTDATTGTPTWSSSNVAVATVSGANVTGKTGGTSTITYKMTSGCYAIQIVTVTSAPAAITGASAVCSNTTITLSDASTNTLWTSTWTSSNNAVASVDASTGIVSGASHGTVTITFSTGCGTTVTHVVTVNQAPGAINGNNSICAGLTTSLSSVTTGGIWSSSNTTIATVASATGMVTGVAAGTVTLSYVAAGCFVTNAEIINGLPTTVTVSGGGLICNGTTLLASNGGSGTIYFQGTTSGGRSTSIPSASEVENTSGVYYFAAESSAGCWGAEGSASVTVTVLPAISNTTNLCLGSTITLSDATTGGEWNSSNSTIATVGSNTGMVTGIAEGISTITYSLGGSCYTSTTITVNSSPTVTTGTVSSFTKGIGSVPLHFHTTGGPSHYNITWCNLAHTAGFLDVTASPLDTLSQDTVLYISVPSSAFAAAYTGTLSVTSTGCISRGAPIKAIINDSLNIYTYAGNGINGYSGDSAAATIARISHPSSVASDCNGNTYIADYDNGVVRKVDARGVITTFAGNGSIGYSGDGGPATAAKLSNPTGIVIDGNGNVYISDYSNMVVRMVNTAGIITTFAGNGGHGYSGDGGEAMSAELNYPVGLAVDNANNIYIADYLNSVIRKVNTSGIITTVAGNGIAGYSGDGGEAYNANLNNPKGVAVDGSGNIYIADYSNNVIRKVNTSGIINTIAGIGIAGYSGDGGEATLAQLNSPWGIAVDGYNNVYFSELHNNIIRKIDSNGMINTIGGSNCTCNGYSGDGGEAINAKLNQPMGISINCSGNLYIADNANFAVRVLGAYNRVPYFINGCVQTLNVAQTSPITSLNSQLSVNDFDTLQTETWSVVSSASNGTLSVSYSTASTGNTLIPTGLSYTPAPGYIGADQFTIQVSDGIAIARTTIYVTVTEVAERMTGVNNTTANDISLQLFPNPSRGNFNIKTSGAGTFYLLSMEGQSVGEYAVTGEQTEITMPSGLPSGVYVGRFKNVDGNTTDVKLVYEQ